MIVAHRFGHAASAPATHAALRLLDEAEIGAELAVREVRTGRAEVVQMWGRPESIREEYKRLIRPVGADRPDSPADDAVSTNEAWSERRLDRQGSLARGGCVRMSGRPLSGDRVWRVL